MIPWWAALLGGLGFAVWSIFVFMVGAAVKGGAIQAEKVKEMEARKAVQRPERN